MADVSYDEILQKLYELIVPLNHKSIELGPDKTFADDLELDSLTVMDLVAAIEDEFDIIMPLNMLPDLETIAQVAAAVERILEK